LALHEEVRRTPEALEGSSGSESKMVRMVVLLLEPPNAREAKLSLTDEKK